jgi:hypothetical protein
MFFERSARLGRTVKHRAELNCAAWYASSADALGPANRHILCSMSVTTQDVRKATFGSVEDASVGPAEAQGAPPNPVARLLPKFKPQIVRSRLKYTRKGR